MKKSKWQDEEFIEESIEKAKEQYKEKYEKFYGDRKHHASLGESIRPEIEEENGNKFVRFYLTKERNVRMSVPIEVNNDEPHGYYKMTQLHPAEGEDRDLEEIPKIGEALKEADSYEEGMKEAFWHTVDEERTADFTVEVKPPEPFVFDSGVEEEWLVVATIYAREDFDFDLTGINLFYERI